MAGLGPMSERKFAEGLQRKGNAAKMRETVSQALRESAIQVDLCVVDTFVYSTIIYFHRNK